MTTAINRRCSLITILPTTLVVQGEQSVRDVCLSVSGQQLSNEITFDLDIWYFGILIQLDTD